MKHFFTSLFFILIALISYATEYNIIKKVDEGLYFMYYDSSHSKSTIVEFEKFIVLIEVPIKDEGGDAKNLKDHIEAGEKIMATLKEYFPTKPLVYVVHSHWHPHSISSMEPFISRGVKLISTKANFEKLRECIDSATVIKYYTNIQFLEEDSLVISDDRNKIIIYRFKQKDFQSTPTLDYLYFYFPNYNIMHTGCMYNKWEGGLIAGKELVTAREEDLYKFLLTKHFKPSYLIRLQNEQTEMNDMQSYSNFHSIIKTGISINDILSSYYVVSTEILHERIDSILNDIISKHIPAFIFNDGTYQALSEKSLEHALHFAKIQIMLNPTDPNAWDTLGEVYYFLAEYVLAKHCEKQSRLILPTFLQGGEELWKKDLLEYKKKWESIN